MQDNLSHPKNNILILIALLSIALTGCVQWKWTDPPIKTTNTPIMIDGAWQIRPVNINIFNTTKFISVDGNHILELHIELKDDMGDPVKGTGTFNFKLTSKTFEHPGLQWPQSPHETEILTLQDNIDHYETSDDCYVFKLSLQDKPKKGANYKISVSFLSTDGSRLSDTKIISPK